MGNAESWKCDSCGAELRTRAKFCSECGTARPTTKCLNCETELDSQWKFCEECGAPTTTTILHGEPISPPPVDPTPSSLMGVRAELSYLRWWLRAWRNWSGSGRSPRVEFWSFLLINAVLIMASAWMSGVTYLSSSVNVSDNTGGAFALEIANNLFGAAWVVFYLAMIIPSVTVFVRRMHDTNRTGWNYFWNLVPLVGWVIILLYLLEETRAGPNKYEGPIQLHQEDKG